tara:strand:+ start:815 stop:3130 length:2316 start_codon:yes stop_codon:yes gene_type:complete
MKFQKSKITVFFILVAFCTTIEASESIYEKKNIATAYLDAELYEDAFIIYLDILSLQTEILGKYNLELINTLYSLSDICLLSNKPEESKKFLKQALDIQYYNFLLTQKSYSPTLQKIKDLYLTLNDSSKIRIIDSISVKISNIEKDTLFFINDSLGSFPDIISHYTEIIDSTNLVSEYSNNDKAIDLIDTGLQYLNMGVFSESAKNLDEAIKLNTNIIDVQYLLNIDYGDSISINHLYQAFYEIEEFDSTITSANLFLGLLGLALNKHDNIVINHLLDYSKSIPTDTKSYILLGDIYFQNSQYIDAMNYYMRALLLNNQLNHASLYMGKSLYHLKYYQDAIVKFNDVIDLSPNNFDAKQYLGISYYNILDYENAIIELTNALLIRGDDFNTYYYLGKSYNQLQKKKQALESFHKSIEYNPANGEAHFELGLIYESILKLDDAIYHYNIAKKYIDSETLNYNLGLLLFNNENYSDALSPLREYIIYNPENLKILEILGDIFIIENRYSEAIDTYDRLIILNPYKEEYYFKLANSYLELGNYKYAKEFYEKVLAFNEENPEILFSIGQIANILNQYEQAEEYFLEAIYCGYHTKDLLFQLGLSYGGQKKYLQALEAFKEALTFSSNDPILHYQLAIVLKELEIYDLAINEFIIYLESNKKDAVVYRMIGKCYFSMQDFDNAINYLLQSSNLFNNKDSESYYYLGLSYMNNNEEWNAAKYFKHVLRINPDHAPTRYQLINVYVELNKKREADKECDILYMLDRELYYSAKFCNK